MNATLEKVLELDWDVTRLVEVGDVLTTTFSALSRATGNQESTDSLIAFLEHKGQFGSFHRKAIYNAMVLYVKTEREEFKVWEEKRNSEEK
jgi:hypothetical protein